MCCSGMGSIESTVGSSSDVPVGEGLSMVEVGEGCAALDVDPESLSAGSAVLRRDGNFVSSRRSLVRDERARKIAMAMTMPMKMTITNIL